MTRLDRDHLPGDRGEERHHQREGETEPAAAAHQFTPGRRQPEGVPYVLVTGVVVVDDGRHTGALAGRALRAGNTLVPRPH